jgi:hypothetical protein
VTPQPETVAQYLKSVSAEQRRVLSAVRDVVNDNLPAGYEERLVNGKFISWDVPLSRLPDTYNKQPLAFVSLAAQKNYYALYLMCAYGIDETGKAFREAYRKSGKKLDMGKACVRFKTLDDLPLDVIGSTVASVPLEKWVRIYLESRTRTRRGR